MLNIFVCLQLFLCTVLCAKDKLLNFYFLVTLFYYRLTANHKKSTFTAVFSCERESKILTSSNLTTIRIKMHELFIFSNCKALFYIIYNYYFLDYHFIIHTL